MEQVIKIILSMTVLKAIKSFDKKVITLLALEMTMLLLISMMALHSGSSMNTFITLTLMSLFMVLDSTLALTILISSSRKTKMSSYKMKSM